jgi:hypothetical protein
MCQKTEQEETLKQRVWSIGLIWSKISKFIWAPYAQLYSLAETLHPHPHLGSYTRALLVSQDRRHVFVTPWSIKK